MTYYERLDQLMKQDFGGRGLLPSLPQTDLKPVAASLSHAARVILLTGFPVRMRDGSYIGETDGPSGTANLAAALTQSSSEVSVVTDAPSYELLKAALSFRAPKAKLALLPKEETDSFIRSFIHEKRPTHFISLERPGKARNGHYHNMRGECIDDMVTDSSLFLSEARRVGAVTISIGDGGNEMGMGTFRQQISRFVPSGNLICTQEAADYTLAGGVSNWWGWGLASLLSCQSGKLLLPTLEEESELLRRVVASGGVDGCTKEQDLTVDRIPLCTHLSILEEVSQLTMRQLKSNRFFPTVSMVPGFAAVHHPNSLDTFAV